MTQDELKQKVAQAAIEYVVPDTIIIYKYGICSLQIDKHSQREKE